MYIGLYTVDGRNTISFLKLTGLMGKTLGQLFPEDKNAKDIKVLQRCVQTLDGRRSNAMPM
ncbi:hypothetical protein CS542_09365 [Pedobacter sp. IW39]|nr:hypothetical protein CS542_09365 [Pedobacter sp. IW39]